MDFVDHIYTQYTILEADEKTHNRMVQLERINIDWESCRVYEYINVVRCRKCQQYNHISKYCRGQERCGRCAGYHPTKNCCSEEEQCVNCISAMERLRLHIEINHCVWDNHCEVFKRKLEIQRRRTDFDK